MMKRGLARLACLLIFATATGWGIARDVWHKHLLGRDGYLQYQSAYFDKHLASVASRTTKFIEYTLIIGVFFALYEGLALLLRIVFGVTRVRIEERSNPN
jgi:hypothetical protein